jgi:hypothetical protein
MAIEENTRKGAIPIMDSQVEAMAHRLNTSINNFRVNGKELKLGDKALRHLRKTGLKMGNNQTQELLPITSSFSTQILNYRHALTINCGFGLDNW